MSEKEEAPILVKPITPEILAENAELQKTWAKNTSIPEYLSSYTASWEHRDRLAFSELVDRVLRLEQAYQSASDDEDLRGKYVLSRDELAEIFFRRGEFETAAEVAGTPVYQDLYKDYLAAEQRRDSDHCKHWKDTNNLFIERLDMQTKAYGIAPCVRCNICGYRQIRPLKPDEFSKFNQ